MDLKGKRLLITGGSSGIGKAIALAFKEKNASITVLGLNKPDYDCEFFECDLSSIDNIKDVISKIDKVDFLVNNAGIVKFENIEQTSEESFDKVMNVNFKSLFFMCKYVISKMSAGSSIVNISSVAGHAGAPNGQGLVYHATKAAIINFTKSLSCELGPKKIRVNSISPGVIKTPIFEKSMGAKGKDVMNDFGEKTPVGRAGKPEEIAKTVLFLVENNYVDGTSVIVDGGMLASL